MCIGNPKQFGDAVEFLPDVVAVINNNELIAVYMKIEFIKDIIVVKKNTICMVGNYQ